MPRPELLEGITEKVITPCGNFYLTINYNNKEIVEIFARIGKGGNCGYVMLNALSRVCSLALREGVKIEKIIETLKGLRCSGADNKDFHCCPHSIGMVLEEHINNK